MNAALGRTGVLLGLLAALAGVATIAFGLVRDRLRSHDERAPAPLDGQPAPPLAGPAPDGPAPLGELLFTGRGYAYLVLAGALLAVVAMERALVTHDFSLRYVVDNNSRETPILYSVTGMWSALQGSILLWAVILAGYLSAVAYAFRRRGLDRLVRWAMLVGLVVAAFFFALMAGPASPFVRTAAPIPHDGAGPNPLLQDNVLVAFHPVFLYLGFVGFTVPFSFAIASLITGRIGEGWLVATRRWTLFAWGFLSIGVVLGAWWSYQVLGWGGFWAWDPVENAALLPWLCGTAFLHSVIVQERRGLLRVWNLSLIVAAFSLTILGTFLTRSGVLVSVHSFSDSTIGPLLLAFFGVVVATGVGLIGWRGDRLRSPGGIDSPVSREGAFLVNNLLFAAFALVVLLGTVFPLLVQALRAQTVTVGRPYFDTMTLPIAVALLFFMAVAPALPWRKAGPRVLRTRLAVPAWTGVLVVVTCVAAGVRGFVPLLAFGLAGFAGASALRELVLGVAAAHRRGNGAWRGVVGRTGGGMVVHLGVVVIAVGFAASVSFGQRGALVLRPGESGRFAGHTFTYLGARAFSAPADRGVAAAVRVDGGGVFRPAVTQFGSDSAEVVGTPAVDSTAGYDAYLTVGSSGIAAGTRQPLEIDIVVQPLVMWLWVGGGILALGALLAGFPERRRRRRRPRPPAAVAPLAGRRGELVAAQR